MTLTHDQIIERFEGTADPLPTEFVVMVEEKLRRCGDCGIWTRKDDLTDIEGLCGLCDDEAEK